MTNTPQSPFGAEPQMGMEHRPLPPAPTPMPPVESSRGQSSRSGGLLGAPLVFLRNLSIRNKMFFVALPPLLVVFLLSVIGVVDRRDEASEVGRVVDLISFIDANSDLAGNIREEAIYSSAFMASQGNETFATELRTARAATDASVENYRTSLNRIRPTQGNPRAESKLREFDTRLANLSTTRAGVDQLQLPIQLANDQYFNTAAASDQLTGSIVQTVSAPELVGDLTNVVNLSSLQTAVSGEATILTAAEIKGGFFTSSDQLCESVFSADCSSFSDAQEFRARVTSSEAVFEESASSEAKQEQRDATATQQYDEKARSLYTTARNANTITPVTDVMADASVTRSATSQLSTLIEVQDSTIDATKARAESVASNAKRAVWLFAAAALAALVIAAAAAAYAAQATIDPLRRLTSAAKTLANDKIPELVQRLRDPQQTASSVDSYARSEINEEFEAISVDSKDEIGQLAEAFRSIQDVTVNVAEQQNELLRKGIGDIFVNLARRNQVLLDRQIQFIEKMEAGEEDPDQLSNLFKLDHLATRMRRNAESLLVLAGAEQGRGRRNKPVAISEVIRVGMGEVEDFQRVRIGAMDPVNVPGNVAIDLAHLLGEVIENATQFSPPDTFVEIDGRHEPTGTYYMRIMDRGIGMDDAAINSANELLANPPFMGLEISRSLGFIVIGRLAARFGIRVVLAPNAGGGVIATVILPAETVMALSMPTSRQPAPAAVTPPPMPPRPVPTSVPTAAPPTSVAPSATAPPMPTPVPAAAAASVPPRPPAPAPVSAPPASPAAPMPSLSDVPAMPQPVVVAREDQPALPRRQPKAPVVPPSPTSEPAHAASAERTPEQVRSMLSRYQAGVQRGRTAAEVAPPPVDAPPPQGAPVRTTERPTVGQSARSPEEVRETLMRYRSGLTRGRQK